MSNLLISRSNLWKQEVADLFREMSRCSPENIVGNLESYAKHRFTSKDMKKILDSILADVHLGIPVEEAFGNRDTVFRLDLSNMVLSNEYCLNTVHELESEIAILGGVMNTSNFSPHHYRLLMLDYARLQDILTACDIDENDKRSILNSTRRMIGISEEATVDKMTGNDF